MAELAVGVSPLADLARPERSSPGPEPVAVRELPPAGLLLLRGGPEACARASEVLGFDLPTEPMRTSHGGGARALWLGPDEWLLAFPREAASNTLAALAPALAGLHHALVPVGERFVGIGLAGARARDALAALCPLDLHPRAFPPGRVVRTLLGKVEVVLHRPETEAAAGDGFELHVGRSMAPYAWRCLEVAAAEFGCEIARAAETTAPKPG